MVDLSHWAGQEREHAKGDGARVVPWLRHQFSKHGSGHPPPRAARLRPHPDRHQTKTGLIHVQAPFNSGRPESEEGRGVTLGQPLTAAGKASERDELRAPQPPPPAGQRGGQASLAPLRRRDLPMAVRWLVSRNSFTSLAARPHQVGYPEGPGPEGLPVGHLPGTPWVNVPIVVEVLARRGASAGRSRRPGACRACRM